MGPETPFDLAASWVMNRSNGLAIDAIGTAQSTNLQGDPTLATTTATVTVHDSSGNSGGRNTGIDTGVGVGIPLLFALLVALGFLWHERRKNGILRQQKQETLDGFDNPGQASHDAPALQQRSMHELNGNARRKVPAELNQESEITGRVVAAELDNQQAVREFSD